MLSSAKPSPTRTAGQRPSCAPITRSCAVTALAEIHWGLYLAVDPSALVSTDRTGEVITESVRGGVSVIQLRDRTASDAVFAEQALRIRGAVSRTIADPGPHTPFHVPVFVHDRFRVALRHGFHLHLDHADIAYPEARRRMPGQLMIGVSVDGTEELRALLIDCDDSGVRVPDVIGIGPVWAADTRRRQSPPLGTDVVDDVAAIAAGAGVMTIAFGGITPDNVDKLGATGVDGVCVPAALMSTDDPYTTARTLLNRFRPSEVHRS
nr:thiamine phosphate synthase [Corynebacterium antarcticum]